jgi:NDP-sugar pyrophosphorylase family protein
MFPGEKNIIFISDRRYAEDKSLKDVFRRAAPDGAVFPIDSHNKGPAYTIVSGGRNIDDFEPVMISYADFFMDWDYEGFKRFAEKTGTDSASVCYRGFHPHLLRGNLYAGVRVDAEMNALEVREKYSFTENTMDGWHQAGLFYFKNGALLKEYCEKAINRGMNYNGEHYLSHVCGAMLEEGQSAKVYSARHFCQWGTPEDLEEYEYWSRLMAKEFGREKGVTDIPVLREQYIRPFAELASEEYKKTHAYWKEYFNANL